MSKATSTAIKHQGDFCPGQSSPVIASPSLLSHWSRVILTINLGREQLILANMWKVIALLPCLMFVAEVKAGCNQLMDCQNQITDGSFFAEEGNMVGYADNTAELDAVCGEVGALTSCIDSNKDSCPDDAIKNELSAVKDIIEYMCSPEGTQVVLGMADSDCIDDPLLETRMEIMMMGCLEDFSLELQMAQMNAMFASREFQMSDVCPYVNQLGTCMVSGSSAMCGSSMGTFMSNIWNIAAPDQFSQFGCSSNIVLKRHTVKRAVPIMLKRAALLKKLRK